MECYYGCVGRDRCAKYKCVIQAKCQEVGNGFRSHCPVADSIPPTQGAVEKVQPIKLQFCLWTESVR